MVKNLPITVVIVDDHAMLRAGLATFLEISDDLALVGEASNGQEAIELCERLTPDVVLMDLVMPRLDGVVATRTIRTRWPETQVVVLTSFQEGEQVQEALQAGAISYLLKNVSMEELSAAIRAAHTGRSMLATEAMQALMHPPGPPPSEISLTPREFEVLELVVGGLNNPEISEKLCISIGTTRTHVSNIFSKMGVNNRAEAIAWALRNKLVA